MANLKKFFSSLQDSLLTLWRYIDARDRAWEREQWRRFSGWLVVVTWKRLFFVGILMLIAGGMLVSCLESVSEVHVQTTNKKANSAKSSKQQESDNKITIGSDGVSITNAASGKRIQFSLDGVTVVDAANKQGSVQVSGTGVVVTDPKTGKRLVLGDNGIRQEDAAPPQPPAAPVPPAQPAKVTPAQPQPDGDKAPSEPKSFKVRIAGKEVLVIEGHEAEQIQMVIDEVAADLQREKLGKTEEELRDEIRAEIQAQAEEDNGSTSVTTQKTVSRPLKNSIMPLIFLALAAMVLTKVIMNTKSKAEAKVVVAQEATERETLQRQLVEARFTTLQAQVEPHFLFNTLASVEHLIEVAPERAAKMQRHLIDYLRAAMPHMREVSSNMGRETGLMTSYLEILKFRMEERLEFSVVVPQGLFSAEVPPMMLLSLVENCIKHGLEPKPEGGRVDVLAEIAHGKLRVSVADTGMGYTPDNSPTRGTRVGLQNIKERLEMLYGHTATFTIGANSLNAAGGTLAVIELPYKVQTGKF